ncbi:MAG: hypothetical protein JEZ12_13075 [Desulfobacterium sp.]|nr:hypothetical protein [Desulfobacterium sp.]
MFKPQQIDLTIYQGSSFKKAWEMVEKGTEDPIDLTGYKARMQVRGKLKDDAAILDLTTENGGITITVVTDKTTLALYVPATATAAITAAKGVYDLELVDAAGDVYRLMQGTVAISKEVTR